PGPAGCGARSHFLAWPGVRRDRDGANLSIPAGALRSRADRFRRAEREACRAGAAPRSACHEHTALAHSRGVWRRAWHRSRRSRHVAGDYRVAMIGFTPGWSYLSGLEEKLHMPRRQNPRLLTPAGTISIGGGQTGVQCLPGPSGWHLLGRTAVRTYQLHRDPTFLLEPGDQVTFCAVDAKTFAEQDHAAEAGEIVAELMNA